MYTSRLSEYLGEQVRAADAYLLVVTPNSLKANSEWIKFELFMAQRVYQELVVRASPAQRVAFFFPCLAEGAKADDLLPIVKGFEFNVVDLSQPDATHNLARTLLRTFEENDLLESRPERARR
jgi:hypothetical protein